MKELEKKLKEIEGGKVLDVASGVGNFFNYIFEFKSYDSITAIDTIEKSGEIIKKIFGEKDNIQFQKMDAYKMNFPDKSFDTVTISNSLHHLKEPEKVLSEMIRVLKDDGKIIINEMYADENCQSKAQLNHKLVHHFAAKLDTIEERFHNLTYDKARLKNFIKNLNLSKTEIIDYTYPMENPKDDNVIAQNVNAINQRLEAMKEAKEYNKLREEADQIIKKLNEEGFAPCSSLFMIAYK